MSVSKTTEYKTTFTLSTSFSFGHASLEVCLFADNRADIFLNDVLIGSQTGFNNFSVVECFSAQQPLQAGSNTLQFNVEDTGGTSGLNYQAVVTYSTEAEFTDDTELAVHDSNITTNLNNQTNQIDNALAVLESKADKHNANLNTQSYEIDKALAILESKTDKHNANLNTQSYEIDKALAILESKTDKHNANLNAQTSEINKALAILESKTDKHNANLIGLDLIEEGMDALIERSLIDDNPHPRWRSLWAIATIDPTGAPAIDDFVAALEDPDVVVSGNAAIALAFFDHDAAREPLIAMMNNPDDYRRWEATFSLRSVPGDGVVEVIVAHIDYQNEPDVRVRQESALVLGDLQDLTTIGTLLEALGADPSPQVRWRAALALKQLGDASVIADLRNAFESEDDPQVLEQITETFEALGG